MRQAQRSPLNLVEKAGKLQSNSYKSIRSGILPFFNDAKRKSPRAANHQSVNKTSLNLMLGSQLKSQLNGSLTTKYNKMMAQN